MQINTQKIYLIAFIFYSCIFLKKNLSLISKAKLLNFKLIRQKYILYLFRGHKTNDSIQSLKLVRKIDLYFRDKEHAQIAELQIKFRYSGMWIF